MTYWCQSIMKSQTVTGGTYVDATMGNGNDTLFFCEMAQETGTVWAFDIQERALSSTRKLLEGRGLGHRISSGRIRLIKDGHENMDQYLEKDSADVICFNFGYLPGGDHAIATKPDTSVAAVKKGLEILKNNGMMSLCIYSGKDTGFEEKERLLDFFKRLPQHRYSVILNTYCNRGSNPPLPVFIFKHER